MKKVRLASMFLFMTVVVPIIVRAQMPKTYEQTSQAPATTQKMINHSLLKGESMEVVRFSAAFFSRLSGESIPGGSKIKKIPNNLIDAACMQEAVTKRDNTIEAGVDGYASVIKSALEARRDALNAAWGNTNLKARRAAIQAAWKIYANAVKNARMAFKKVRNDAWDQFRKNRATCSPGAAAMDATTGAVDGSL